ncbi:MAG: L,D-transpeptidase [Deltaproteobacteria bacterium]|nr:L,D-transpeptidase [Deltaproteobacteria bacterium]
MARIISIFLAALLLAHFWAGPAAVADVFKKYEKVIYIDQLKQVGAAYENGKKIMEFPVLTGDDEKTTNPGVYIIGMKVQDYFSRKYQVPMPYSLFFDMRARKAVHEGEVPPPEQRREVATHGCVHVEQPHMEWLFEWAEVGKTRVVIYGWRSEE